MAKYSRYDARNKKQSRHKRQSLEKDLRIRRVDEDRGKYNYNRGSFYAHDVLDQFTEDLEHDDSY